MSDSVRLAILKEIVIRLNTSRPADVPEFELLRTVPTELDTVKAATVYPAREPISPVSNRASKASIRTLRAIVEVRVGSVDPVTASDPALQWVTAKLGGVRLAITGHSQLTHEILEVDVQWKIAQRLTPHMVVFVELEIPYVTKVQDQTAQPS